MQICAINRFQAKPEVRASPLDPAISITCVCRPKSALAKETINTSAQGTRTDLGFCSESIDCTYLHGFQTNLSVASALEPEKAPVRPICVLAGKFILFHLAKVSHVLGDTQVPSPAFWGRGGLRGCRWEEAEAGGHVVPARGMHKSRESQIPDLLSTGE